MWGDRTINVNGTMVYEDKENGLKAVVIFFPKQSDHFVGKLYKYDPSLNLQKKEPSKLSEIRDIQEEICDISGSWLENLKFGEDEYWNIDTMEPLRLTGVPNPLPSDPRYREDLLWLHREKLNYA